MGISLIYLSEVFEIFTDFVTAAAPVFFTTSEESSTPPVSSIVPQGAITPEPGTFLLATSRRVVSPALAWFIPRLNHPGCHLDPGSSLYRTLLAFALLLFGLARETSEAPSITAHEEHSLRVRIALLRLLMPVIPIASYIPASSVLNPLLVSCGNPQTLSSTCLYLIQF